MWLRVASASMRLGEACLGPHPNRFVRITSEHGAVSPDDINRGVVISKSHDRRDSAMLVPPLHARSVVRDVEPSGRPEPAAKSRPRVRMADIVESGMALLGIHRVDDAPEALGD